MPREDGSLEFGYDGFVVSVDAVEDGFVLL